MSIPKVIHYCWFGGNPFPATEQMCFKTWKRFLPDYEFKLWNEDNFDITSVEFVKKAYAAKKWAFVADYVRIYALYTEGGLYLDTDVEVRKSLNPLLSDKFFTGFNYPAEDGVEPAVMAAEKGHPLLKLVLSYYMKLTFDIDNLFDISIPRILTNFLVHNYCLALNGHRQELDNGIVVYPDDIFFLIFYNREDSNIPETSYTIHHGSGSWLSARTKFGLFLGKKFGAGVYRIAFRVWNYLKPFFYSQKKKKE